MVLSYEMKMRWSILVSLGREVGRKPSPRGQRLEQLHRATDDFRCKRSCRTIRKRWCAPCGR